MKTALLLLLVLWIREKRLGKFEQLRYVQAGVFGASNNVFVERVWRTIKYERVYLRAYENVSAASKDIAQNIGWYDSERAHSSLKGQTPEQVWLSGLPALKKAA